MSASPNASSPSVLVAEHLTRTVGDKVIVNDISFAVDRGEIFAIVGPSGAGKSSLLRLLNRLDEPTSGTYFVEGRPYTDFAPRDLRCRVGMVMQSAFLFPGTVADNVRFGPRQRGHELTDAEVEALLAEVRLSGYAARSVANLSGGEAQRVSLARALANSPVVLLADEPTSALDDDSKRGIEQLIVDIVHHSGVTCILVTHDMAQAARIADRVLIMEAGRAVRLGPTEEVLRAQ